jgi:carboxyl-terminal processing protease
VSPHRASRAFLIYFSVLCISSNSFSQPLLKNDLYQLKKILTERHVQPRAFDNNLSHDVVQNLLTLIDPEKLYFTEPEVYRIIAYQTKIENDLNKDTWTFVPFLQEITMSALTRAKKNLLTIQQRDMDLESKEILKLNTTWADDEATLQKRMASSIKLDILMHVGFYQGNENTIEREKRFTKAVYANTLRAINKLLENNAGFENAIGNIFIKAFLQAYDAHSVYMPPVEMQNFVTSLSSQGFHFGFTLDEDVNGAVVIKSLMPGSPAWKCGEIHTGDIIDALGWHGKQKTDATLLDIEEIEAILMESNNEVLDLSLRLPDGCYRMAQ